MQTHEDLESIIHSKLEQQKIIQLIHVENVSLTLKTNEVKTSAGIEYHVFLGSNATHCFLSDGLSMSLNLSMGSRPYFCTRYNVCTKFVFTWESSVDLRSEKKLIL